MATAKIEPKVIRVKKIKSKSGKLAAIADIELSDAIVVHGLRLWRSPDGALTLGEAQSKNDYGWSQVTTIKRTYLRNTITDLVIKKCLEESIITAEEAKKANLKLQE